MQAQSADDSPDKDATTAELPDSTRAEKAGIEVKGELLTKANTHEMPQPPAELAAENVVSSGARTEHE